jgi:hypothetical protein
MWMVHHSKTTVAKNNTNQNTAAVNAAADFNKTIPDETKENNAIKIQSPNEKDIHQNKVSTKLLVSNKKGAVVASKDLLTKAGNVKPNYSTENDEAIYRKQKNSRTSLAKTNMQITGAEIETASSDEMPKQLTKELTSFSLLQIDNRRAIAPSLILPDVISIPLQLLNKNVLTQNSMPVEKSSKNTAGKHQNISFSILFGLGKTATASSYLGVTANRSYYDNAREFSSNVGGQGTGNSLTSIPSTIKPATGFYLGFAAEKNITKRSSLSLGLQYQFTSTSMGVGQAIVAADGNKAFATGNSNSYINKYHFIEIPIDFSTQLSNFKKHNLYVTAGGTLSQLLHTNALQYNNIAGQYFIDNDYFNKTIIGLSAGISINLLKNNKAPLLLGPIVNYSITPLAAKGLYDNSRYGFLGFRLQKVLK